jgi:hypothetical protein
MLEAREKQLMELLAEAPVLLTQRKVAEELLNAIRLLEDGEIETGIWTLKTAISEADREKEIWQEFRQIAQEKSRLADVERKRIVDTQKAITIDRLMLLLGMVSNAMMEVLLEFVNPERYDAAKGKFATKLRALISGEFGSTIRFREEVVRTTFLC